MSKPFTIEELKALQVGDWVWIEQGEKGCYAEIQYNDENGLNVQRGKFSYWQNYSDYSVTWLAYKNKEQAENTQITNAEKQMILYLINAGGADLCQKCIHLNKPTCGRYISPTDYSGECSDDYCIDGMLQYFERENQ